MLLKLCTAPLRILKHMVKTDMSDKTSSWRGAENAEVEMQEREIREQIAGVENAGVENAGVEEYGKPQE